MNSKFFFEHKPFGQNLKESGLSLDRVECNTLQINVGLLCNLACRHCHLEAGPARSEIMSLQTVSQVIDFSQKFKFDTIDVTGGAPEMNPHIMPLLEGLSLASPRLILRSNLVALGGPEQERLIELCRDKKIVIVASFPALNEGQADSQRGKGIFQRSIAVLQKLNRLEYGKSESGLELDLVSNPTGAIIPSGQEQLEKRFREVLKVKWGIEFNRLLTFANVPLGRFWKWLQDSGNYGSYMDRLIQSFNPCALTGVMCRNQISVGWNGSLYDCDFNQSIGLGLGGKKVHLSDLDTLPEAGTAIAVSEHCYACTAGSGFT